MPMPTSLWFIWLQLKWTFRKPFRWHGSSTVPPLLKPTKTFNLSFRGNDYFRMFDLGEETIGPESSSAIKFCKVRKVTFHTKDLKAESTLDWDKKFDISPQILTFHLSLVNVGTSRTIVYRSPQMTHHHLLDKSREETALTLSSCSSKKPFRSYQEHTQRQWPLQLDPKENYKSSLNTLHVRQSSSDLSFSQLRAPGQIQQCPRPHFSNQLFAFKNTTQEHLKYKTNI